MPGKPTLKGINRVFTIRVNQPLIDQAQKRDSGHCMIADAIRAAIPEAKSVSVDLATIRFTDPAKGQRYIYLTPRPAQLALIDFDQGVVTQPFNFQLTRAAQVVESGRRTAPDGTTRKSPGRAVQGITSATGSKQPVKLGGSLPAVGALSSKPSQRKLPVAAATAAPGTATAKVLGRKPTAAEKRAAAAAATKAAEEQAAGRDRGTPVSRTKSNVTLGQNTSRIRKFGIKQLRP